MFNIPKDPVEIVAVATAIIQVILAYRKNIYTYPFGIISSLLYVKLCFDAGIYADMSIMLYYFVMSIIGWINWGILIKQNLGFIPSKDSLKVNLVYIFISLIIWLLLHYILSEFTDSTVPVADSFTTALCIMGMYLMAKKKIENWIYLLIADIVSVPLYYYKELYFTSLLYVILCVFAVLGYYSWKKNLKECA